MVDDTKHDTIEMPRVIPAGHAREALILASARLAREIEEYTAVAEAIARALDATVTA